MEDIPGKNIRYTTGIFWKVRYIIEYVLPQYTFARVYNILHCGILLYAELHVKPLEGASTPSKQQKRLAATNKV
jgi:hypothetical protein